MKRLLEQIESGLLKAQAIIDKKQSQPNDEIFQKKVKPRYYYQIQYNTDLLMRSMHTPSVQVNSSELQELKR